MNQVCVVISLYTRRIIAYLNNDCTLDTCCSWLSALLPLSSHSLHRCFIHVRFLVPIQIILPACSSTPDDRYNKGLSNIRYKTLQCANGFPAKIYCTWLIWKNRCKKQGKLINRNGVDGWIKQFFLSKATSTHPGLLPGLF